MSPHKIAIALILSVLLSACAGTPVGPDGTASLEKAKVDGAIPFGERTILFQRAGWNQGAYGFQQKPEVESVMGGALSVTEQSVSFILWDRESSHYKRLWSVSRHAITDVSVESFGQSRCVVISSANAFYTVSLGKEGSPFVDVEGTEKLGAMLSIGLKK
ncbi:MAG: hypothetical protein LLG15_11130 [Betaproteobacteria bacterium]|nr:hypothetical protein [Betaproteobacteria bacterium]